MKSSSLCIFVKYMFPQKVTKISWLVYISQSVSFELFVLHIGDSCIAFLVKSLMKSFKYQIRLGKNPISSFAEFSYHIFVSMLTTDRSIAKPNFFRRKICILPFPRKYSRKRSLEMSQPRKKRFLGQPTFSTFFQCIARIGKKNYFLVSIGGINHNIFIY
jgi:hypothetical protein